MKKRPNHETAHTQSRQRGAQTTSRSSALVRGRSTQFIANPCRWPQRQSPETRSNFCHFRRFYLSLPLSLSSSLSLSETLSKALALSLLCSRSLSLSLSLFLPLSLSVCLSVCHGLSVCLSLSLSLFLILMFYPSLSLFLSPSLLSFVHRHSLRCTLREHQPKDEPCLGDMHTYTLTHTCTRTQTHTRSSACLLLPHCSIFKLYNDCNDLLRLGNACSQVLKELSRVHRNMASCGTTVVGRYICPDKMD